jgi:hypothetical protein
MKKSRCYVVDKYGEVTREMLYGSIFNGGAWWLDRDAVKSLNISSGLSMFTDDCFDVGYWGGCGAECHVFIRGECENNQEISKNEVMRFHHEDEALKILSLYGRF